MDNSSNELKHYGVIGMRWGVRRYRNKYGNTSDKAKAHLQKHLKRASGTLKRYDKKYDKLSRKAGKYYDKADRKAASLIGSQKGVRKALKKANKAQARANVVARKGEKYYRNMEKYFTSNTINMTAEDRKLGETFINDRRDMNRARYGAYKG